MVHLPSAAVKTVMLAAYQPCRFFGCCREARWDPAGGHIPRGYLGATGAPEEVEVVMVFAEPGQPHFGEMYDGTTTAEAMISACTAHAYDCFRSGLDLFHRNVRWFMDQLYPDLSFDQQLRRVWLTEGRLCSIDNEIGKTTDRTCATSFLRRQIDIFPNAVVAAFGGKAKHYLSGLGIDYIGAYALAPPGANHRPARPSWEEALNGIRSHRRKS